MAEIHSLCFKGWTGLPHIIS